jgi:protein phosphatase
MDFLRRIFGSAPTNAKPSMSSVKTDASTAATNQNNSAPRSVPNLVSNDINANTIAGSDTPPEKPSIDSAANKRTQSGILKVADGVTRPLPPDVLIEQSGYEHLAFGQATDVGMVRTNNQDAAFSLFTTARSSDDWPDFGLFVVADGMGGHHDGEKASAIASRVVGSQLTEKLYVPLIVGDERQSQTPVTEAMVDAILKANNEVVNKVPDGGTTMTVVTVIGDLAYIAHVGDSRVYFIQRDKIEQLTRDHSLVQRLIELDQLTEEEAADHPQKNVLYRALGQNDAIEVDTLTRRLPPHTRILLCSDGLWNQVSDDEILDIVNMNTNPQEACRKLVSMANTRGGLDNVTVILLQLPG